MIWRFPRKKIWPAGAGEIFFGRSDFQKNFLKKKTVVSQKTKIQRGGQKALLEGVGSILNFRGGVIKNRNSRGSTPP